MLFFSLLRPVVAGLLQGSERYVAFGVTRTVYAASRLALALLLIGLLGGGAVAAIAVMPAGALLALLAGLLLITPLWRDLPSRTPWLRSDTSLLLRTGLPNRSPSSAKIISEGWRLSLAALFAYTAYMLLQNMDLVWVNRTLSPDAAGSYATAVVLRRVLAVLPGAVLVILFPRLVARVAQGLLPDRTLLKAALVVGTSTLALTVLYFLAGPVIISLVFGEGYAQAGTLLGWQGLAMVGYGLAAVWLNLFLATRPWPFVALLAAITLLQIVMLSLAITLAAVTAVFILTGWLAAVGGLLLYLLWLRPALNRPQ
jgi:O-antigen/teichoic acid export membrane protein